MEVEGYSEDQYTVKWEVKVSVRCISIAEMVEVIARKPLCCVLTATIVK